MPDQPPLRLQILGQFGPARLAVLQRRAPDLSIGHGAETDEAPAAILAWDRAGEALARLLDRHADTIRWVHVRRVGLPDSLVRQFDPYPHVVLTNGRGASGIAVAEYVLAVTLALFKRMPELHERQRRAEWVRGFEVAELRGRTVCIVGLGDLGRHIARVLRPLGVKLLGVRRRAEPVAEVDETHTPDALPTLLERTDVLILAAPLTPDTRYLIGPAELARLPRGSYLINVGRGQLLDEAAVAEALRSGHLAGAALDVFAEEPLLPSSPLWSLPNAIITPHASTHTQATDDRGLEVFLDNLDRFRRGEPLQNVVDRALGY